MTTAVARPEGTVTMRVTRKSVTAPFTWKARNVPHYMRGAWKLWIARVLGIAHMEGTLRLRLYTREEIVDYGIVSHRVVTTAGVNFIVDAFQGTVEPEIMKYHGFGTGGTAEAVGDTALVTELTTQYATDNTRPTGTQTENGANVYRTVATLDPDSAVAITEHGIFSQAAVAGGTVLDRSLFAAVNVAATGDTLEATYDITFSAGG